jgi:hypothetical protein
MFWTILPSIIRSPRLYIRRQVYVIQVRWPLASELKMELHFGPANKQSTNLYDIHLMPYVESWTPDDGWKDRPKYVEWYSTNSKNCASSWFCYRKEHSVARDINSGFSGLEVACWPLVPKFAGSHLAVPVRFLGRKILSTPSFRREVKPSVPCRSFTAHKTSLNVTWRSAFRQNYRIFLSHSSIFCHWVLSRGDTRGNAWWQ